MSSFVNLRLRGADPVETGGKVCAT
jgi:hypothetical protein